MREFLKKVLPFWEELEETHKYLVLDTIIVRNFKKNDKFYHVGNEDVGLMIVHAGRVRVFIASEDGNEMNLYRLLEGQASALSLASMMHQYNIDINMQAEEDLEGYVIPERICTILSEEYPAVKAFIHEIMVNRLGEVIGIVSSLVFKKVPKRLADKLLYHRKLQDTLTISITHEELASDIGSAREVVSRTLQQFKKRKLIEAGRGKINIMDELGLKNF